MTNTLSRGPAIAAALATLTLVPAAQAITLGQVDDFSTGQQGWGVVGSVTADGGPAGPGDAYFAYASSGSVGSGGRMLVPNELSGNQWAGDYLAAGVTGMQFDVLNDGSTQLDLRLAIGNFSTWFVTSTATIVPGGTDWSTLTFAIEEGAMTRVLGSDSFDAVAAGVERVRLLSSVDLPTIANAQRPQGDRLAASIGIDNVTAIGVPEPAAATLAALVTAAAALGRRRNG